MLKDFPPFPLILNSLMVQFIRTSCCDFCKERRCQHANFKDREIEALKTIILQKAPDFSLLEQDGDSLFLSIRDTELLQKTLTITQV